MSTNRGVNPWIVFLLVIGAVAGLAGSGLLVLRSALWGDASELQPASYAGDLEALKRALDGGAGPAAINARCRMPKDPRIDQSTALMIASMRGFSKGVDVLLSRNCDPTLRDRFGFAAIHHAAMPGGGGPDTVESLLAADASLVDCAAPGGITPLMLAVQRSDAEGASVVAALLKHGARADATDEGGWSVLRYAAAPGDEAIAKMVRDAIR